MKLTIAITTIALAGALGAQAQEQERKEVHVRMMGPGGVAPQAATMQFISAGPMIAGKAVKGAPYSAEQVNEFTQTLADGTRIHRKSSSRIARDSEGRVRTENSLGMMAPMIADGKAPRIVAIHDPVAKEALMINDTDKTATRLKIPGEGKAMEWKERTASPGGDKIMERHVVLAGEGDGKKVMTYAGGHGGDVMIHRAMEANEEKLGTQTFDGVVGEGTRVTHTIPIGEIGNDRPLQVVTERWYSSELQTMVMMRTTDPQHGETMFRLSGINRAEPDRTLFQVPAGYTVKDGAPGMMMMHGTGDATFERKIERRVEKK
ncbi:MAG: hypothetical protein JJE04_26815 [Acidobacteriia bacterium]|nr:hypothetical protein [Terriglobia bacterium]